MRVIDKAILDQTEQECAWFNNDKLVKVGSDVTTTLQDLYKDNAGTYNISILAVKEVQEIIQLKNSLMEKFKGLFTQDFRESFIIT